MSATRTVKGVFFLAVSLLGGALGSALAIHWLVRTGDGWAPLPLVLGALFGGLGWLLAENLGEAVTLLLATAFPGLVVLVFLENQTWRILTIAFLCGFNIGKLAGGFYRESGD